MADIKRVPKEQVGSDEPIWEIDIHLTLNAEEADKLAAALDDMGYQDEASDIRDEIRGLEI